MERDFLLDTDLTIHFVLSFKSLSRYAIPTPPFVHKKCDNAVSFEKAVMVGGLLSTTLLGTIIDKKDLYAKLAAESYADMADDPEFWKQMTEGMSPEEKEKAKELMERIKTDKEGKSAPATSLEATTTTTTSDDAEASSPAASSSAPTETPQDEAAKASNDMFSDY